jgi:hypothetical protein
MKRTATEILDRASWGQLRSRDLTASRIAAIFDCGHPFLSREQLCNQLRGHPRKRFDSFHMRAGRILEAGVALAISESRPDWHLVKATAYYQIPELRLGCTPDYLLGEHGLVQIGTVSPSAWRSGEPPAYKIIQTHFEMIVTGRREGWLPIMIRQLPELPLHLFEIPYDPVIERAILDASAAWWRAMDRGEVPPAAPSPIPLSAAGDGWHRAPPDWLPAKPAPPAVARTRDVDIAAMFGAALRGRP